MFKVPVHNDGTLSMPSKLPYMLTFQVGAEDDDYVKLCYAGDCWSCNQNDGGDNHCTLGNGQENGYENGDREGDMGFNC